MNSESADLKTSKFLMDFLKMTRFQLWSFAKKHHLTRYKLNSRVSRYDMNEVMAVLAEGSRRKQATLSKKEAVLAARAVPVLSARIPDVSITITVRA